MRKFFCIAPFYPVQVIPEEDYFYVSVLAAKQLGLDAELLPLSSYAPGQVYKLIPRGSLIHCHGMTRKMYELYWRLRLNNKNCRMVITPHASFGDLGMFGSFIPMAVTLIKHFDIACAISPYEYDYYIKRGINCLLTGLGVDTDLFLKICSERNEKGILFFGGDRKEKNSKALLDALKLIDAGVRVTITECNENKDIGNMHYRKRIAAASPEYFRLFKEHDIFVNSSYNEGFPLGVMEAYASGMKCCVSDIPTLRSVYGDSVFYHRPDDYNKLAEDIKRCLIGNYPEVSGDLIKKYNYKTVICKLSDSYKKLLV